jgi:hypothetical protein
MQDTLVRGVRLTLYLLLGEVAVVLLIACGNLGNRLWAKATARTREIAVSAERPGWTPWWCGDTSDRSECSEPSCSPACSKGLFSFLLHSPSLGEDVVHLVSSDF